MAIAGQSKEVSFIPESTAKPPIWLTVTLCCLIYGPWLLILRSKQPPSTYHTIKPASLGFFLEVVGLFYEVVLFVVLYSGLDLNHKCPSFFRISSWINSRKLSEEVRIGILISLLTMGIVILLHIFLGPFSPPSTGANLTPHGPAEITIFLLLMVAGATVEELIFRGYFFQFFYQWTGSSERALILQAAAFSAAHGPQTFAGILDKVLFGLLLGWVANRRQSLVPGIIAHAFGNLMAATLLIVLSH